MPFSAMMSLKMMREGEFHYFAERPSVRLAIFAGGMLTDWRFSLVMPDDANEPLMGLAFKMAYDAFACFTRRAPGAAGRRGKRR